MLSHKYTQIERLAKTENFPGNMNIILSLFNFFFYLRTDLFKMILFSV